MTELGSPAATRRRSLVLGRYRPLLRYARPHARGWAAIVLVTLLSTAAGMLAPWPLKVLVDNVLGDAPPGALSALPGPDSPQGLLVWVAIGGLIVFFLISVLDVLLTTLWIKVGQAMVYDLARDLFARVQRRSLLYHKRHPVGDTMSRVAEDSWSVHTVVDELLFTPGHAALTAGGLIAVMLALDPQLTLLGVVVVPLMVVSSLAFGRPIRRAATRRRRVEVDISAHVQQTLTGITVVQAFGQERRQHSRFVALARDAIRSHKRVALAGGLNALGSGLITTAGTGVILFVGAHSVLRGDLTLGSLLVFLTYLTRLQRELGAFAGIYSNLQGARAGVDRVLEVLEVEPEVADRPGARGLEQVRGEIELDDVVFGYDPERPVLRGVSLHARPGEVVAIVGATGAGKSTLVSLIPRFFDPQHGSVRLDGHDLRDLRLTSLREQISLVLQESFLFPISIADNIAYGRPGAGHHDIQAAARAANAHDFISALPDGYDTIVGERGATLSGGERQRVAIARALLKDAPVLILDEPTSALDAETENLLLEALDRLMTGRTTLIIAHRLSTIRAADQIVVLQDGHIIETGTHHTLVAHGGTYARLHHLQTRQRPREVIGA